MSSRLHHQRAQGPTVTSRDIVRYRTVNQRIAATQSPKPEDAVFALGAVQAQDYKGALWAVGLRTRGATEETVERAIADRTIVRTWPMRGTLHFVVPRDVRWMLKYLAPRMIARGALRRRQLHIDDETLRRSRIVLVRALRDGKRLTREAAFGLLEKHSIPCGSQRGIHIVWQLAQEGYICFGPREEKQPTVVLLDDWVPMTNIPYRDEALGTLALRYFTGHGPATLKDFVWWSGLPVSDARDALESIKSKLNGFISGKATYWMHEGRLTKGGIFPKVVLLPPFDEYLVGYN
ncbi:MAG TPA: winged helix DNA-binding domain-containing protein, partial [Bacteroidota bacterium]